MTPRCINLKPGVMDKITKMAGKEGRTVTGMIRWLIDKGLEREDKRGIEYEKKGE
jgi:hypothetical protein